METELAAPIVAATVYPTGAQIARTGAAVLDGAGEHVVRIGGLPRTMVGDSLRAVGRGPAGTRILSVDTAVEYHPAAPEETLVRLREQIEDVQRATRLAASKQQAITEQQGWLRAMGEQSGRSMAWGVARGSAKPEDARALIAYAAEEGEHLASQALDAQRETEELQLRLAALQRELQRLQSAAGSDRLAAEVRLAVEAAGSVEITLTYVVRQASWVPRYDARVDPERASVAFTQQALVTQTSGERWESVSLTVSTARPALAATLPDEPSPWYLDAAQPIVEAYRMPAGAAPMFARAAGAPSLASAADAAQEQPSLDEAQWESPVRERIGTAQAFRVATGADVPSDGAPHVFGIGSDDLPCRMDHIVMPAIDDGAQLRAVATNTTGRVLLPGALHVFYSMPVGDQFVGATHVQLTAEGADLTLYLGRDDGITVKRQLVERDTDKGSLLQRGVRVVTFGYRTTLVNRTSAAQHIIVKESLPVARHEKIKVRPLDVRPQPAERTKLEQLTWDLTLAPGETGQIDWRAAVESPTEMLITPMP